MPAAPVFNPANPVGGAIQNAQGGPAFNLVGGAPIFNAGGVGCYGAKLTTGPLFEEIDGYKERWRNDGTQEVVRCFKTLWSSRKLFVDYMLGYSNVSQGAANVLNVNPPSGQALQPPAPVLSRTIPDQVPEGGYQHLYASDVELFETCGVWANNPNVQAVANGIPDASSGPVLVAGGNGKGAPWINPANNQPLNLPMIAYYDPATGKDGIVKYRVSYTARNPVYEIRSDDELNGMENAKGELERYVSRARQNAIQAIPLPAGSIIWQPGTAAPSQGQTIPAAAAFVYLHTQALTYTWYEVPDEPAFAISACTGCMNDALFDGAKGAITYPVGTLLCQAPLSVERYRHTTGRVYWKIVYSFLYRNFTNPKYVDGNGKPINQGWSSLPDADGNYWPVVFKNSGAPLYPTADLNTLFQAPPPVTYQ